jgi:uncharacterized protein (DUF305 family)
MHHYLHLAIMTVLSFLSMYVLMYAMVDTFGNIYPNVNQLYMAALMTAPMVLIEIGVMRSMYKNTNANIAVIAASLVVLVGSWMLIRQQGFVADRQFLKSMIPHHAGAILMCEQAPIRDDEIRKLCQSILSGQRAEIAQMRGILKRLDGGQ